MRKKVEFEKTEKFIFEQASNRIRAKKDELGLTLYQIAGFNNQESYNNAESYEKLYSVDVLSKIMNNNRTSKKTRYLIPATYHEPLIKKLKFNDTSYKYGVSEKIKVDKKWVSKFYIRMGIDTATHQLLWGNREEIQEYSQTLFFKIAEDAHESENGKVKNAFEGLYEVYPESDLHDKYELIYLAVKQKFIREFIDYTMASDRCNFLFEIIETKSIEIYDIKNPKELEGTIKNSHLGFKKLNESLEKFVELRVVPLLLSELISKLS
ncbi:MULTISPECIES: hypothetical protein [Enterococcus]|uniref:hypothetical protein n=1 Tax=Enterococcus TaxID=1350 RepID=UPI0029548067|nr:MULTISPECIES: hypothetical protein [Enterococcus]MDV7717405.1 hypothetical protein [Enterococcus faecium]MDV7740642.1 hypothetical protein [Enterococcus gallinarum]